MGLQIRHQEGSGGSFAGNVPDHQPDSLSSKIQKVVVITSDLTRLPTNTPVFKRCKGRLSLRKESCLYLSRDILFLRGATFMFQPLSMYAALRLDFAGHLVIFQERK